MAQSPSGEANWFAASQEIPCISRNPKVHYHNHKRPPPVSILGQPNSVHIPTSHLLEIHPNIHPSTPRSPQWSPSLRFPQQDPIHPQAEACNTDTTPTQPHRNSNTHRTKNNMTNVVIQQNSRKLLMMDTLMSETCWAHKKWNKIASDFKLVFYSSAVTMLHSPINIRFTF